MERLSPISGLLFAVGIAAAGWFVGNGIVESRSNDRYVTVKGLSERQVNADVALWRLTFNATNNSLSEARNKITADKTAVLKFLKDNGIAASEISVESLRIEDRLTRAESKAKVAIRYLLEQSISVRSTNIKTVAAASQNLSNLLDEGVLFGGIDRYHRPLAPSYIFTGLNDIKPDMIAEATSNARLAAMQFATDAKADIKGIRRARQGRFEIRAANNAAGSISDSQMLKTVRVVTTIDYILGN